MANEITVTKNTTSGSERWDVAYTADASGTVTKTMDTAGTLLDRDVKVSITTPSGSATTPATTITANPSISVNSSTGVITASNSKTQSVTPTVSAGYVSSGTAGTITVSGSNTSNLTTQAAQTIYPSTSDQTIASGKYLTGTQTVKGVLLTNLSAGNIKKDVVVKVGDSADDDRVTSVTGTYEGSGGGGGVVITDTTDTAGGTIRTITAVNLGSDTVAANKMLNGTTAHDSTGTAITGNIATKTASDLEASGDTVTVPAGYYASQATKSVSAGTAGTPTATKGTVSNHTISVTPSVTNTSGYITGSTKTGTAVSVSASELVSGTLTVDSSGTKDVTNYASASVPSGTAGTPSASKGSVSNHAVTVTPSVTNVTGWITGSTKTGTGVSVSASELVSGDLSITQNGSNIDCANYATVSVNVSGGGGGVSVATATSTPSSASSSIQFTSLQGEPTSFVVVSSANLATGASPYKTAAVVFDGTNIIGQYITNTSNAQMTYSGSAFSKSYSSGTLTITGSGSNWQANEYTLLYTYGGSSSNIGTADVQVGSGATSITFTDLPDEPTCWSCMFKDNIGTSSGYTRAHVVVSNGSSIYGMEMGSGSSATANWTASYSNGSLTISSTSTSAGGYFHQPGYYQLTYVIGGTVELTTEPLSVTQNGTYTAPLGKAYTPVTVNVSGGASIATETMTNSSNQNTSIDFTLPSGRTPKAFFARLTSQIARNSSSRYYYVYDMRWDGSSTGGVAGNQFYMYNGTLSNVTSGYSYSQDGTTFTLSSTGSRSAAPGSFYNGTYELVYVY